MQTDGPLDLPQTLASFTRRVLSGPSRRVLFERDAAGAWAALSNIALLARAEAVALGLRARGLTEGDRVALMAGNRVDWIVANFGILFAGCVSVPIYATQAFDQVAVILEDSGAAALFVDTPAAAARLATAGIMLPPIVFDATETDRASLAMLEREGHAARERDPDAAARLTAAIDPAALAILVYTSGTTGEPKGVMLSHRNIVSNASDSFKLADGVIFPGDPILSILPLAHIYENTNIFGYLLCGAEVYINRKIESLLDDLRSVRPIAMFAVPRVFERIYAGVIGKAVDTGSVRAKLVIWALAVGLAYRRALHDGGTPAFPLRLQFALAHKLVLGNLRGQLGCDRLRYFVSGSAALHLDIALVFAAADMLILEGYGLSECSPAVTINKPLEYKLGTVGMPIPNVEIRIAEDGELLVRGPNVMLGYYHRPVETAAAIVDGWLHSGDIASLDPDGFVRIVDRKKEIFKTSGGKYVSPARVETALARSPYVSQAVVFGNGKPHPAALIAPNWTTLRTHLALPDDEPANRLMLRTDVREFIAAEAERTTAELAAFEQIRWVGVLPRELTIDAGEVTPTLKVRRRIVEQRYGHLVREYDRGMIEAIP